MITEEAGNHRVMHNRLVRLVLEVRLPALSEMRRRPPLEVLELLLSRSDLDTSLNTICSKRPSTLLMPFIEYALLDLRVSTNKVIETLGIRLSPIH
ncbi:hypothetical protein NPN18_23900, partial [Vibrio parahaemolyticus]|nr:hypothetical protein [Vibrio parahaemolyticus]